ncbi:MAG: hypothetical protein RL642_1092, partial [Bacteroidota bacterium]
GGLGAGIQPIWQASFSEFLRAEAVLTLGIAGDARAFLEAGVRKSISKVIGFPATIGYTVNPAVVPSAATIDAYVTKVLTAYDAAATNSEKLNVVMKEWYIALWGNGADANNNYRRTGMPNNFQFAKLPDVGPYIRSFLYPSTFINLNKNAPAQNAIDKKVFWDTNPAVLK